MPHELHSAREQALHQRQMSQEMDEVYQLAIQSMRSQELREDANPWPDNSHRRSPANQAGLYEHEDAYETIQEECTVSEDDTLTNNLQTVQTPIMGVSPSKSQQNKSSLASHPILIAEEHEFGLEPEEAAELGSAR